MSRTLSILFCASLALFSSVAADVSDLPDRERFVQEGVLPEGTAPAALQESVTLLYFVRDASARNYAHFARLMPKFHAFEGAEDFVSLFVFSDSAEARKAVSYVREQSDKSFVGLQEGGEPIGDILRKAGWKGDVLVVFSRSGRAVYAATVTEDRSAEIYRDARRVVTEELGSAEIRVQASLPGGEPAAGYRVAVVSRAARRPAQELFTDDEGGCYAGSFFGPPVTVFVFREDSDLSGLAQVEREGLVHLAVELEEREPVVGRVVGKQGDPVPGARLAVEFSPRTERRFAPHPVAAGEIRADAAGWFAAGWLPRDIYAVFEVSAEGRWTETLKAVLPEAKGASDLEPFVLLPADKSLDFVLLDLEGRPLPDARCQIGPHSLRSDTEGRFRMKGLPDKPLKAHLDKRGLLSVRTSVGPGLDALAVATAPQVSELKKRLGLGSGAPPWKVEAWAAGNPVEPEEVKAEWLLAVLIPPRMEAEDRRVFLGAMADWSERYELLGMRSVAILPSGTPDGPARRMASALRGVSVGVDAPIESEATDALASRPGYTEAVWRGWGRWEALCYVQAPSGRATAVRDYGDVSRTVARVERVLESIEQENAMDVSAALDNLRAQGRLVWSREDPHEEGTVWVGTKSDLLMLNSAQDGSRRFRGALGIEELRPTGVAFATGKVFVGTPEGLIVYERGISAWNRLAPGGDYSLVDASVDRIAQVGQGIEVRVRPRRGEPQVWRYREGEWSRVDAEDTAKAGARTAPAGPPETEGVTPMPVRPEPERPFGPPNL